jgi:hypothetical protein
MAVVRVILLLLVAALALLGDTFKLYMKEGGYHMVREYQVQGDRIRYYSTERGDWEEIPAELIDLKKTEAERKGKVERIAEVSRAEAEEEKAERDLRKEIASIPMNSGAYFKRGEKVDALPSAEYQIITDKKRKALQVLSPIPLVPGKASVVIKGEHATFTITEERPEFYLRLTQEERFGIVSLTPKKNVRVVENISILPIAKQADESRKQMATFEQDLGNSLYKVWPEKPLPPGEYALVEFADSQDATDIELIIWDFARLPQ